MCDLCPEGSREEREEAVFSTGAFASDARQDVCALHQRSVFLLPTSEQHHGSLD